MSAGEIGFSIPVYRASASLRIRTVHVTRVTGSPDRMRRDLQGSTRSVGMKQRHRATAVEIANKGTGRMMCPLIRHALQGGVTLFSLKVDRSAPKDTTRRARFSRICL